MLRSDHRELLVVRQGTFSITKTWYRYLVLVRAVVSCLCWSGQWASGPQQPQTLKCNNINCDFMKKKPAILPARRNLKFILLIWEKQLDWSSEKRGRLLWEKGLGGADSGDGWRSYSLSGFPVTSIFPADHWAELTVVNGESVGAEWYHVGTGCCCRISYL